MFSWVILWYRHYTPVAAVKGNSSVWWILHALPFVSLISSATVYSWSFCINRHIEYRLSNHLKQTTISTPNKQLSGPMVKASANSTLASSAEGPGFRGHSHELHARWLIPVKAGLSLNMTVAEIYCIHFLIFLILITYHLELCWVHYLYKINKLHL